MKIVLEKIPVVLQRVNGWAGFEVENGKKKPISLKDFKGVGATDSERLVDFETAAKAVRDGTVSVIGVSLAGQGITCIDIDCHEPEKKGKFEELNSEILSQFNSYAETSISGLGTHIFINGKKPEGYKHCDKYGIVEVYDCSRFIITTGNIIEGHDTYIATCQEELNSLCEKHLIKKESYTKQIDKGVYNKETEKVIDKLRQFKKGNMFWQGKWDDIEKWDDKTGTSIKAFPSQSEADFSFASLILFLNGNNPTQAEEIFLKSGMWNKQRADKKSSGYIQHTIAEASIRCNRVYDWDRYSYTKTEQDIDFNEVMENHVSNQLLAQAKDRSLRLTENNELNEFLTKYILNYGGNTKEVMNTLSGDFDSSANGIRFWLLNKNDLVYLREGDEWLAWNGKYWDRCYDNHLLFYAERVFHQLKHEAYNLFRQSVLSVEFKNSLEEQALNLFRYASTKKGKRQCLEMIEFSKTHFIQAQKEQKVLEKLSENKNVINLQNGLYDFDNFCLVPHSKEYYQTKIANVSFEEKAGCPLWSEFIKMVLPNEDMRKYLQKAIGYTLSSGYMEKCMFILYGENGNNGKTTITKTLHKLMGDYAVVAEKQTIMDIRGHNAGAPRPDLLRLRDRRFICISESEKDDKLAEGLIKNLTGGGLVICRTLNHEPVEFNALFKIWLDTNYLVQVRGTDQAIWNRLKVIKFDVTIPPDKIDLDFGEKLEKELSGIFNWAVEGYKLYKAEGLKMPDEMQQIIKEYSEDMSSLDMWVKECVEISLLPIKNCLTSKELYQSYNSWCKFNGEYAWTQKKFTQEINRKEGFKNIKKVKGYIKYTNVSLNNIGLICYRMINYENMSDFTRDYHKIVSEVIKEEEIFQKKYTKLFNSTMKDLQPIDSK